MHWNDNLSISASNYETARKIELLTEEIKSLKERSVLNSLIYTESDLFNKRLSDLEARFSAVLKVFDMKIEEMNKRISFIRHFYKAFKIIEKGFNFFKRNKK
jgi:hypothetical protein